MSLIKYSYMSRCSIFVVSVDLAVHRVHLFCFLINLFDWFLVLDVAIVLLLLVWNCLVSLRQGGLVVVSHLLQKLLPLVLLIDPLLVVVENTL